MVVVLVCVCELQGEKALKKWSIFSGGDKYEEASEAFSKAGNAFKLAKECTWCRRSCAPRVLHHT